MERSRGLRGFTLMEARSNLVIAGRTKGQSSHGPLLQGLVEKIRFRTHIIRTSTSATSPVVLSDEAPGGVATASGSGSASTVPTPPGAPAPLARTPRTVLRGIRATPA